MFKIIPPYLITTFTIMFVVTFLVMLLIYTEDRHKIRQETANITVHCVIYGTSVGFDVESATGSFESTLESIAKIEEEKANYTVKAEVVNRNTIKIRHGDHSNTFLTCSQK